MVREMTCQKCGRRFGARRSDARFCSSRCRAEAWRHPQQWPTPVKPAVIGPTTAATRHLLGRCGVDLDGDVAQGVLRMARAVDDPDTPPRDLVSLTRGLQQTCGEYVLQAEVARARADEEAAEPRLGGPTDD